MAGARGNSFDEVELVHLDDVREIDVAEAPLNQRAPEASKSSEPLESLAATRSPAARAPRIHRILALATDLSLFVAIGLALSPLVETGPSLSATFSRRPLEISSMAAFLLLLSYYYFPLCWMIWGRTVGASLFDLRIISDDSGAVTAPQAAKRWTATLLSLATGLLGFLPGLLPSARTVPDRVSRTHVVRS